jgi:hypothetical protein
MTSYADVAVYLKNLGIDANLNTFAERVRVQKMVYMLKQFGADLGFGFTWYLRGPYSPSLTKTLFNPTSEDARSSRELNTIELKVVNDMRNFLGGDFYSADRMELVASLIYLIKHGPDNDLQTKTKIVKFLRDEKPQYSPDEIEQVWRRISAAGMWNNELGRLR